MFAADVNLQDWRRLRQTFERLAAGANENGRPRPQVHRPILYFRGLCMEIGGLWRAGREVRDAHWGSIAPGGGLDSDAALLRAERLLAGACAECRGIPRLLGGGFEARTVHQAVAAAGFYAEGDSRAAGYPPALCGTAYCRFRAMAEGGSYCARAASADRQQDCFVGGDAGATVWRAGRNGGAAAGVLSCGAAER